MDFARQQRDPTRHLLGISIVILVHAIVIYALVTGLARRAVEVIKKPLTATIIEEIKLPPPPPPAAAEEDRNTQGAAAARTAVYSAARYSAAGDKYRAGDRGTDDHAAGRAARDRAAAAARPPPPKPAIRRGSQLVVIDKVDPVFPERARRDGVESGKVVARLQVDEKGSVTDVRIVSADSAARVRPRGHPRAFEWQFKADGDKYDRGSRSQLPLGITRIRLLGRETKWPPRRRPFFCDSAA